MAKKRDAELFRLVSEESGFTYYTRRNPKKHPEKLAFRKFDPYLGKHVNFVEKKMPKSSA